MVGKRVQFDADTWEAIQAVMDRGIAVSRNSPTKPLPTGRLIASSGRSAWWTSPCFELSPGESPGLFLEQPLRYSAATGGNRLGELTPGELSAEWDPKLAEPFVLGAFISASGLSERRDFPSK